MIDFLTEEGGKMSMVRVCLLISVLAACYIGVVAVHKGADLVQVTGLVGVYLAVPFVAKVKQKGDEI